MCTCYIIINIVIFNFVIFNIERVPIKYSHNFPKVNFRKNFQKKNFSKIFAKLFFRKLWLGEFWGPACGVKSANLDAFQQTRPTECLILSHRRYCNMLLQFWDTLGLFWMAIKQVNFGGFVSPENLPIEIIFQKTSQIFSIPNFQKICEN